MKIEPITGDQADQIEELARSIWPLVYDWMISPEQMQYMLEWMYSQQQIRSEIDHGTLYIILRENREPIGFASCGPVDEHCDCPLHKLYVHPDAQGHGAGIKALNYLIHFAEQKGAKTVTLRVNRTNQKAIQFYEKHGFTPWKEDCADIGGGFVMDDYIMRKTIRD